MRITPTGAETDESALFDDFQSDLAKRELAPATIRVYLHDITVFQNWLEEIFDASPPPILQTGTAQGKPTASATLKSPPLIEQPNPLSIFLLIARFNGFQGSAFSQKPQSSEPSG